MLPMHSARVRFPVGARFSRRDKDALRLHEGVWTGEGKKSKTVFLWTRRHDGVVNVTD